ncbi:hypothetical protein O1611_g2420 [Lasiodiplodia mahajangana]|uniref:Uncharacterized protein n=1 Tax=Lasiodiplodia mahajangana TaxID=1108764 RepID=A0ACC2JUP4_9PEZI|nr:hypothetical protein O1611_g2420 [Lasiodiplodia mahajangana]
MPFDDDEDPTAASLNSNGDDTAFDAEDGGDQAQDFRLFASSLARGGKKSQQASGKAIRRGEKDFESHGTRAQESVLESSRSAMHEVLSYTRHNQPHNALRGWYFPDRWADVPPESEPTSDAVVDKQGGDQMKTRTRGSGQGLFARERVVALESDRSTMITSMGRVITSAEKSSPGWLKTWLLPEEALFLIERETVDLWWPARGIEEVFPEDKEEDPATPQSKAEKLEDYELGVPLSLQAAYALFIGKDGERGKISLEKYQVYANLRRTGYKVLRAAPIPLQSPSSQTSQSLWQWLIRAARKAGSLSLICAHIRTTSSRTATQAYSLIIIRNTATRRTLQDLFSRLEEPEPSSFHKDEAATARRSNGHCRCPRLQRPDPRAARRPAPIHAVGSAG